MRTCQSCGKANPVSKKACSHCGTALGAHDVDELLDAVLKETDLDPRAYEYPGDREGIERLKSLQIDKIVKIYIKRLTGPQGTAALLGNAIEVTDKQFRDIYESALTVSRRLTMAVPRVFILQNPVMNAATYGVDEQHFVMLTSALVDALAEDEIMFILGHEFGHIKSNHVLYLNAAHWAISGALALLGMLVAGGPVGLLIGPAFRLALNDWSRKAEYTADRAGLLACRDLRAAALALLKITLGSRKLMDQVDLDAFLEQVEEKALRDYSFVEMFQSHPFMPKRIRQLQQFHAQSYHDLVSL